MKTLIFLICLLFTTLSCTDNAQKDNSGTEYLNNDWKLFPSVKINSSGDKISIPNFDVSQWHITDVPKTVLAALVDNFVYKDIYFGKNLEKIPTEQFKDSWWYRKSFNINNKNEQDNYKLTFEGINYRADVWLNGSKIESKENIEGAFGIFDINISDHVISGENVLAVEIFPPQKGDLTIGFVDWNPNAPDKNMGIWRSVKIKKTGQLSIDNLFAQSKVNLETLKEADITISADLTNYTETPISGKVIGRIEDKEFSKEFSLNPSAKETISFEPTEIEQLHFADAKLWWPNNLGEPNLYELELKVVINNEISDKQKVNFGIREVEDYLNENGHRGYKVNGKKVLIKGAGWVDDMLLNDSDEKVIAQVEYAKHMNLNTIRLEGFWGKNQTLYNTADENGILIMVGWSCQWEWTGYCDREETQYMCIDTPRDIEIQSEAYIDQVKWLRNHPSIFVWVLGSDKYPSPELETIMNNYLEINDPSRPTLLSCKGVDFDGTGNFSEISGAPGVKMLGPYAYESPNYWYLADKLGGAYGFNTETGPGPQVPPLESIKKMIPEKDLWPINDVWDYHCGRHEFNTLDRFTEALNSRYGESKSVEEYVSKSQISNYEAMRPMFESFGVNKPNTTGIVQWMYNSAWPEMFWQFFDYYLMPNGSFYGAKKGCQPLNLVYNYKDGDIYLVNDYLEAKNNLRAELTILNNNSDIIYEKSANISIEDNSSKKIIEVPEQQKLSGLYFINLELFNSENVKISDNFYWLSTKEDVLDFDNSQWFYTPFKSYADFTQLNSLAKAEINYKIIEQSDNNLVIDVTNESKKIAFFIDLRIFEKQTEKTILPVFLSDNYFSLLPGKTKRITGYHHRENSIISSFDIQGWNTNKLTNN